MSKFFIFFILIGFVNSLAGITWTSKYDEKNCNVFVQVNEDNQFLFAENLHIPGFYTRTACWDSWVETCHVNKNDTAYTNGMKRLGVTTFTNKSDQICYFENLGLNTGNMGGFYVQELDYVNGVNIKVSCENASSMSQYCAKSEKMARQVLFAKEELKCSAQGGKFTGGVYPQKMANDSTEYCISVSCDVCDSQWYLDLMEEWKEDVCCEQRGMEPNTNNGSCERPRAMDSTKIGATHSKITAFPGCSKIKAGGKDDGNFCKLPESSFSTEESSSSSDEAVSSSIESESSSSSEINTSSSSEEQEEVECYTDDASAETKLGQKVEECEVGYGDPHYEIDFYGCVVGSCDEYSSSSSAEDEGPGDDWLSSSSEEDGQCRDPSLMKERSNDLGDEWIYVGKEKYSSKIVSYEETKPAKSGFFDALGRMYKKVKSKIRYFVGKETKVKKTMEVDEELDVWKKTEIVNGKEIVFYKKKNEAGSIVFDSIVYENRNYSTRVINVNEFFVESRDSSGVKIITHYNENIGLEKLYYVGLPHDELYNEDNSLKDGFLYVSGDTSFYDVDLLFSDTLQLGEVSLLKKKSNDVVSAAIEVACPGFKSEKKSYEVKCWRYPKEDVKNASCNYYPGENGSMSFGETKPYIVLGNKYINERTEFESMKFCEPQKIDGCVKYVLNIPEISIYFEIFIYASNWAYENGEWKEECWSDADMNNSFAHEKRHLLNGRNALIYYEEKDIDPYRGEVYTKKESCELIESVMKMGFSHDFYPWSQRERGHVVKEAITDRMGLIRIDPSPKATERKDKTEVKCQNIY